MSTLVNNDFESGATLASYGYTDIVDCAVSSAAGLGGSAYGVRGTGAPNSTANKYCEYTVPVTPTGLFFDFQADFDHADDASDPEFSAFEMQPTAGSNFFALIRGFSDRKVRVDAVGFFGDSAAGVIPASGTKCTIRCCGRFGTPTSPSSTASDGFLRVMVDGVTVISADNIDLEGGQGAGATVYWQQLQVGPMGRQDNLIIGDTGCGGTSPTVLVNNSAECCGAPGVEGSGAPAPGAGVEKVGQTDPTWSSRVPGGGAVPSHPDLTDSEDWSG